MSRAASGEPRIYKGKARAKADALHQSKILWTRGQAGFSPNHSVNKPVHKTELVASVPSSRPIWVRGAETGDKLKSDGPKSYKSADPAKHKLQNRDQQPRSGVRPDRTGNKERPNNKGQSNTLYASAQSVNYSNKKEDPNSPFAKLAALKAQLEIK